MGSQLKIHAKFTAKNHDEKGDSGEMSEDDELSSVNVRLHVCECKTCRKTFDAQWEICPSCGSREMEYEKQFVKTLSPLQKKQKMMISEAKIREEALDYDTAIQLWERLGNIKQAARVRKLKAEQGSVKVAQKVVQGDEVTKTEIKDSVLNRSNVGGGSSKMQELKELKEMFDSGFISKEEMENMKKEILGK